MAGTVASLLHQQASEPFSMSASAQPHTSSHTRDRLVDAAYYAAVGAVGVATVGLLVVGANPALAVVPVGGIAFAIFLARAPLRWSTSGLLFLMLALDETLESYGQFRTPFAKLGDLLHYRIDSTIPIPGASVSGMELLVVVLLIVRAHRAATGSRLDETGRVEPARIVRDLLVLTVVGVLYAEVVGLAQGWAAVPWKLRNLLHPLLLAALFVAAYRGPTDAVAIGRIVVFAACAKGILAHVVQRIARAETGGMYNSAISHGDSMIFAVAVFLIILRYLEKPDRRLLLPSCGMLGLIFLGCIENDRRLVWVMIAMACVVAYLVRPLQGWQRVVTRVLVVAIPLALVYMAVGWNSQSRLFFPVQTLRGVADTSHDTSAYWREVEIWNIATSMRQNSVVGMGLGGEYTETMYNDDISSLYKEYREWPHNTVLGLLMMMGLFGFTAQWVLLPASLFLAARSYRMAGSPDDRLVAMGCIASVVICLVMAWGDTGAHYPQYKIFAALAVAFSAKLAVATGAWPRGRPA